MKPVNFSITTACNMACPDCLYGMRVRHQRHASVSKLLADVDYFADCEEITITGGEPTCHPEFDRIVDGIRSRLPKTRLLIETNGVSFPKWYDSFKVVDWINVSHYTPASYAGCPDNTDKVELLKEAFGDKLTIIPIVHMKRASNGYSNPCNESNRLHYSEGLVYGCCIGPGIDGASGVRLDPVWEEAVKLAKLPCINCPKAQP